jgi:hypothetical protein
VPARRAAAGRGAAWGGREARGARRGGVGAATRSSNREGISFLRSREGVTVKSTSAVFRRRERGGLSPPPAV